MTQNCINSSDPYVQYVFSTTTTRQTITTTIPFDDTIPQNTEGDEILTVTITPTSASSRLEILFSGWFTKLTTGSATVALFQDSTADALTCRAINLTNGSVIIGCMSHIMTSGTTSATTFKIRAGPAANTLYFLGNNSGTALYGAAAMGFLTVVELI